jgi:hypothetical protein
MPTKSEVFVQEFVLGFGFLGGLFTWVGVDPEEEVIRALLRVAIPENDFLVSLLILLIVIAATAMGILGTYSMAGKLGLIVVGLAWISGFIIAIGGTATIIGAFLFFGVLILGPVVCDYSKSY